MGVSTNYCFVATFGNAQDTPIMESFDIDLLVFMAYCFLIVTVGYSGTAEAGFGNSDCQYLPSYRVMRTRIDESSWE